MSKRKPSVTVAEVARRDRWTCHLCGLPVPKEQASRDHVRPVSMGGSNDIRNLRLAHAACNVARGTTEVSAARRAMRVATPLPTQAQKEAQQMRAWKAAIFDAVARGAPLPAKPKKRR